MIRSQFSEALDEKNIHWLKIASNASNQFCVFFIYALSPMELKGRLGRESSPTLDCQRLNINELCAK